MSSIYKTDEKKYPFRSPLPVHCDRSDESSSHTKNQQPVWCISLLAPRSKFTLED